MGKVGEKAAMPMCFVWVLMSELLLLLGSCGIYCTYAIDADPIDSQMLFLTMQIAKTLR